MVKRSLQKDLRIPLRAVVYRHAEWWIAHCLELDLVAEGKTAEQALDDLLDLCVTQLETALAHGDLAGAFRSAPPEIWATFSRATDVPMKKHFARPVERFEAREATLV